MPAVKLLAASFVLLTALAGCGGSTTDTASAPPVDTATSAPAQPVAIDDACGLLSAEEINAVLGTSFGEGEQTADDTREIVDCKYTMTDDSTGVELPVAIADVGVSQIDGKESYDTNIDLAPAYFGGEPEDVDVSGADKAYVVTNAETQSPVLGMLVGERFILIQIGVEGTTPEQAVELAQTAAARVG